MLEGFFSSGRMPSSRGSSLDSWPLSPGCGAGTGSTEGAVRNSAHERAAHTSDRHCLHSDMGGGVLDAPRGRQCYHQIGHTRYCSEFKGLSPPPSYTPPRKNNPIARWHFVYTTSTGTTPFLMITVDKRITNSLRERLHLRRAGMASIAGWRALEVMLCSREVESSEQMVYA